MAYVKNYNPGQIRMDLPTANYIYELPLLSFGDVHGSMNLSLIFNYGMKAKNSDPFHMAEGYKLNVHKKLVWDDGLPYCIEADGKSVTLNREDSPYTFNDDSQRILRETNQTDRPYVVENADGSKEYYNGQGMIVSVEDKYGAEVLVYNYNSSGKLSSCRYREGRSISFFYASPSNRLDRIMYGLGDYITSFAYTANEVTVTHYSGVEYNIASLAAASFSAVATGTESSVAVSRAVTLAESQTEANARVISNSVGADVVNSVTYKFPASIDNYTNEYPQVEVTDQQGVKTRMQYKGRKLLYSYEVAGTDVNFLANDKFSGTIQIYNAVESPENQKIVGYYDEDKGISLGEHVFPYDTQEWSKDISGYGTGYYYLTGWVKTLDTSDISNHAVIVSAGSANGHSFNPRITSKDNWSFFVHAFPWSDNFLHVRPQNSDKTVLRDLRFFYQKDNFLCGNGKVHSIASEDMLIYHAGEEVCIPLREATIYCGDDVATSAGVEITLADLLKFKINMLKNQNTNEFYFNHLTELYILQNESITVLVNNERQPLSEFYLGSRTCTADGFITTRIRDDDANAFLVYETLGENDNLISSQTLNEYLDVISTTADGVTTTYVRSNDLVTSESVKKSANNEELYTRTTVYGENSAGSPTITATDEFGKETVYTLDPVFGAVVSVTLPDNNKIVDEYDDGRSARTKRYFGRSDMRTNVHSYAGGNLSRLQSGSLSYDFAYSAGKLTGVSKNSVVMEQHVHTDADLETNTEASTESFYPTQASLVYSTKAIYDKYGRLTAIDGVLTNVYDHWPTFDETTGALNVTVNNGNAYLAMTTDEVRGETARFHYNINGTLAKKTVTKEADFSNKISEETFDYDNMGRLDSFVCTYNFAAGQGVTGNIEYAMDASAPNADSRVKKYTYTGTGAGMTTTQNTYDDFKRITQKTYSIGTAGFTKDISYNATRVDCETDHIGNADQNTYYQYYDDGKLKYIGTSRLTSSPVYAYDQYGQLVRENNKSLDKSFRYVYDENGNLVCVETYAYTTGVLVTPVSSITLGYTADRLTSFNGATIAYNTMGCPTTYDGRTLTWSNGRLSGMRAGTAAMGIQNYAYTYNGFGQRVARSYSKMNGLSGDLLDGKLKSANKQYYYDHSGRLIAETGSKTYFDKSKDNESIVYLYDESSIIGMAYTLNGTTNRYYFQRNLQGDVVGIFDTGGGLVARYLYDAWGNCTISGDTTNTAVANANPIRYRGYYYDDDTGLYYLNARYYSPKWRRFISPDDTSYLDPDSVNGLNLYCYCYNDPVNYMDASGHSADSIWKTIFGVAVSVGIAAVTIGAIIASGGTLLVPALVGAGIGAGLNLAGQVGANLIAGKGAFEDFNWGSLVLAGLTGAAFATGAGGLVGAGFIGGFSNAGMSAFEGDSWGVIGFSAAVGFVSGCTGFAMGKYISKNYLNINMNLGVGDYINMARVDGAGFWARSAMALISKAYTLGPTMMKSGTRAIVKIAGNKIVSWIESWLKG